MAKLDTQIKFNSQAGQDQFVHKILVAGAGIKNGSFVDIGCGGLHWSNTLALEELGWSGWLMDASTSAKEESAIRSPKFILGDATKADWSFLPDVVDYLSLDVDEAGFQALERVKVHETRFKVITIEHDTYRFGDTLRTPMRKLLAAAGYDMICGDVSNPVPFEDWWVAPELVDMKLVERMRCNGKQWKDIIDEKV